MSLPGTLLVTEYIFGVKMITEADCRELFRFYKCPNCKRSVAEHGLFHDIYQRGEPCAYHWMGVLKNLLPEEIGCMSGRLVYTYTKEDT